MNGTEGIIDPYRFYQEKNSQRKKSLLKILSYFTVIVLSLIFILPFGWLLSTSLKSLNEIFLMPPTIIPNNIRWDNYAEVFRKIPFLRYTFNTALITVMSMAGQLFAAPLVAYSVSLINWWGKKIVFVLVLATMMIPVQVTMIPVYLTFQKLGLVGTYWPLIIPTFTGAPLYIFLLRQFFLSIPESLIMAARIDGASEVRIYYQIVLPLCKPALATVGVFTLLYTWSDFLSPLIYINRSEMYTLSLGLQAFLAEHYIEWPLLMAASAMFTIPIVIIFFFAQKQFIEGITLTGLKG